MAVCCLCDETKDLFLVEIPDRGNVIRVLYCKKHIKYIPPAFRRTPYRYRCCGQPVNKNGKCSICGDQYPTDD